IKDAQWIAQLHRCGLIEGSMVPSQDIRDLRDQTRYRRKMVQGITAEKNRIHKILQDANIKLTSFMSDLFGVSGRAMLEKLIDGEVLDEPEVRALVKTQLKKKVPHLLDALNGKVTLHHRKMMNKHWRHLTFMEAEVKQIEADIDEYLQAYKEEIGWLDSIPGIDLHTAAAIFAEIGPEASTTFPTDAQLASWVGICPGNNESAGKKKNSKCPQGNKHVKAALCQASWANGKSKNRIGHFFRKIRKRRGEKKASVAAAHMILRIVYALLRDKTNYKEEEDKTDKLKDKSLNYFMKQIQDLGFNIQVTPQNEVV
ncbi:IS110 family transposase, partial [Paenibacillus eucommiae]|uniref:IS110 family transposase n=1 Tax=Paenibacillus eucommiae TaxID=1355755 RepID=UPI001AE652FF